MKIKICTVNSYLKMFLNYNSHINRLLTHYVPFLLFAVPKSCEPCKFTEKLNKFQEIEMGR